MVLRAVIPVRMQSSRLHGKPLLMIGDQTMLQHVYQRACQADLASVLIATDSDEIIAHADEIGADVCLTAADHCSGTERIAEAVSLQRYDDDDIIVNVQGDEPMIAPQLIKQVSSNLDQHCQAVAATLCQPISDKQVMADANCVKVVRDHRGYALYFSRAMIPWQQSSLLSQAYHHIGLYAYRVSFLKKYLGLSASTLEQLESLEQLRILHHGYKIYVGQAQTAAAVGVDTVEDLEKVRKLMSS